MKPAPRNLSRRNFLLAAGAGGAVATAALMNQRRNDTAPAGGKKTAGSTGYAFHMLNRRIPKSKLAHQQINVVFAPHRRNHEACTS